MPPINTVPAAQSVDEDSILPIAGVSVADIDSSALTTTLSVAHGILNVTTSPSVTGNGTASVTIAGTAAQINAALAGLAYAGNPDFNGADTLTIVTSDGTATDTDTIAITVNALDDPAVAQDDAATVAQGGVVTTVDVLLNDIDVDVALTAASITAFTQGANGTVVDNGDGTFTYTHDGSATPTSDTFTYTIDDGAGGTDTATVNVTIIGINQQPELANPIPDQISPRHALWQFQVAADAFSDVDGPALTYTATLGNGDPLPYWLTFDAATRTFSGTPPLDGDLNQPIPATGDGKRRLGERIRYLRPDPHRRRPAPGPRWLCRPSFPVHPGGGHLRDLEPRRVDQCPRRP